MQALKHNHWFWLILACIAIFCMHLDVLHVNIMEARNFITAREMLQDDHWLLTTMNGEPRYNKPPLPTWITAISGMLFGLNSIAGLRLPAALMGMLLVLTTYRFAKKVFNNAKLAFVGGLILATSFYVVSASRDANWDIFTHAFMMVCIYQLFLFFTEDAKKYLRALIAGLFFGLAFMSKGPVSLYALLLPFIIAFGVVFKYTNLKSRLLPLLLFLVVGSIVSGWWYGYTYLYDAETVAAINAKEAANWTGYNVRPFYYYWSFFTQSGIWTIPAFVSLLYPYLKNRVSDKKGYLFTFLWTMASVVLLSLIPEKKSRYLLPVLIPLALNTAYYMDYIFRRFSEITNKKETVPIYIHFGIVAAIGIGFPVGGYFFLKEHLAGNIIWFVLLCASLLIIGSYILIYLRRKQIEPVFYLTICFIAAIVTFGMPMARAFTVNPEYTSFSALSTWQTAEAVKVFEFTDMSPELVWEYGKPLPIIKNDVTQVLEIPSENRFGVLVAERDQELFEETFKEFSVEKIRRYDMNPQPASSNSHKTRLWRDLFLVERK
ncbi:ArnT family glycosyltransferase [Jejudonia soesokkakensis]|uniref:ArnT family glycosyltransferase n=1 Tax=Jejudonia soesokkakensis TaxID=1323432 RepID=A0ABW2MX26_9FLAO